MRKRILSACMALCLMLTMLPVNALAADPPATDGSTQIEGSYYTYDPQDHEFSPDGDEDPEVTNRSYEPNVTISKEIQATDVENQFDITLTVKTDEAIEVSTKEPDAAIVLVIDVSTSMDYCASCGQFYGHAHWCENQDQTRLDAAKEAAKDFLADYAQGAEGAARYVSVIAYSDASGGHWSKGATAVVQDWVDVSSGNALYTINEEIDNIDSYTDRNGTNTDAGLEAAEDQLQERDVQNIDNKFLLLLTDGEPNRSTGDELDWRAGYVLPDGYPQDNYRGESYTNPARRAMYIRNELDTEFYSISYTAGSSVSGWMKSFSDLCVTADNGDDLSIAFEDIIFRLQLTVDAWKVTDPMGEYIEYEGVENANSHANGAVSYNRNRDTLTWDLRADLASDATTIVDSYGDLVSYDDYEPGMDCTITYSLTYRVTLDVAAMVDDEIEFTGGISDYVLTNGPTQLDYYLTKTVNGESVYVDDNGDDIESGENPMLTMYFKVPKVRGYVGTLEFTKVDEKSDALSGAGFTLTMEDDNWSTTAESDEYGVVQFENIPSGHTYTLEETEVPEGYVKADDITITVQYGNVTYRDGSFGTGTDDGLTLVNQPTFVPDPGLSVKKELTSVTRGEKTLTDLDGFVAQVGDTLHYTITVTNTGNTEQSGTITDTFTVGGGSATLEKLTAEPADSVDFDETPWTFSGLASKGTITITADYTVQPGDKSISNGVSVTGTEDTPEDPDPDDNTVETDVASLTVEKKTDRETAFVGDTITYTITVTNTGDVAINDITVEDDKMPETVTVKTGVSEATTGTAENGTYTIGTLEAGSVVTITYTYTVKAEDVKDGKVSNTVTVKSDDLDDPVIDSTETTILPSATKVTKHVVTNGTTVPKNILSVIAEKDLTVTYPAPAPVDEHGNLGNPQIAASAGDEITLLYEISVYGDEGAYFFVTDEPGTTYIGVVGAEISPMQTLSEPPQYRGTLNGTSATLYFTKTFTVEEDGNGGLEPLTNSISAIVDGEEDEVTEEVDVLNPGLNVDKTVKINDENYVDGMVANEKDVLTYTITVKNNSNAAITGTVTVTDDMWVKGKVTQVNLTLTEDGKTITLPANVSEDGTLTVNPVSSVDTVFEPGETWTCTYTYTVTAEDVIAGSVSNTVTAESGNGDESTDEVTVPAGSITITPADITIYTGGNGYSTVVDENGETVDGSETQGLPEPGYYIDLPEALNEKLLKMVDTEDITTVTIEGKEQQVIDLSGYLKFTYDDGTNHRVWTLERYDKNEDNKSMAYNRYIYRLVPAEDQVDVRLQFTDGSETTTTNDVFELSEETLYQTYKMTIYPGALNQGDVQAVLDWSGAADIPHHDVTVGSGELTVRGITDADGEATTTEIVETAPTSEVDKVTAVIGSDTNLYINESSLEVADTDSVELLVDSVVSTAVQDLKDSAVDQVSAITDDHEAQFYYLDLVDTDNGNTVVTTKNELVTLFFPYPEGTDADTAFHIVHYVNQDRDESAKDEIADVNEGSEKFAIEVYSEENQNLETTDQGIQITVTSFSPFGLFWEEDSGSSGGHTGGGGSSRPSRPTLNTEDHYSYIIGYSDGTLQPYGTITRGEVATIFFRLLTDDSREEWWSQVNDYSDCNSDLWCNNAISTLSNMGIIDGFSDGTFRPYAKITRAQFAKIAVGFFETTREDYQGYFTDVDIDAWYTEYVEAAARVGLIEGFNDGTFRPNTNITRAQACVIVNRALGRAPDEDRLLDEDEMITWPDNNPDDWFYADMQEATNSHDYTWTTVSGDKVENWTDKLPQRDWAALEHAWSTAHSAPGGEVTE